MTSLIAFVKNHPVIGGVAFAVFGIFLIFVSIDGAKRFRLYENARESPGRSCPSRKPAASHPASISRYPGLTVRQPREASSTPDRKPWMP